MKFTYQARNKRGEIQTGTIEASSKEAALKLLASNRLIITAIESEEEVPVYAKRLRIFERVKAEEVALFSRQLAIMFGSEMPLMESLRILAQQTSNMAFREKLLAIANDVEGGTPFSQALSRHPKIFSGFYVNMVKSGEVSGKLSEIMEYLANHLEREYQIVSKVKTAMYYPIFVLVFMVLAGIVMMVWMIPQITSILMESEQELPLITRMVIALSDLLKKIVWFLPFVVAGIFLSISRALKNPEIKRAWSRLSLKMPVFGKLAQKMYLSRFAENLATLISGGLPIGMALQVSGDVVGNIVYKEIIYKAKEAVRRGEPISSVLVAHKEMPPLVAQMVRVGEKTGRLDQILLNLSNFYRREVDIMVDGLTALIEPFIIVLLGAGVFMLVAAVLLPIYNMSSSF